MKGILALCLAVAVFSASAWAAQEKPEVPKAPAAAQSQGAARMAIVAGPRGNVDFPHLKHQTALKDCNLCHNLFPREPGVIVKKKASGTLEAKRVMKACIACHKERLDANQPAGPTACAKCHGTAP